jgi:hypothetical protein
LLTLRRFATTGAQRGKHSFGEYASSKNVSSFSKIPSLHIPLSLFSQTSLARTTNRFFLCFDTAEAKLLLSPGPFTITVTWGGDVLGFRIELSLIGAVSILIQNPA